MGKYLDCDFFDIMWYSPNRKYPAGGCCEKRKTAKGSTRSMHSILSAHCLSKPRGVSFLQRTNQCRGRVRRVCLHQRNQAVGGEGALLLSSVGWRRNPKAGWRALGIGKWGSRGGGVSCLLFVNRKFEPML